MGPEVWELLVQDLAKQKTHSAIENTFSTFQLPLWTGKGEAYKELLFEKVFPGVFNNSQMNSPILYKPHRHVT